LGGCASSGWSEGGNLTIEYRWADGRTDHLPELADELVARKVDAIVASGTPTVLAAKHATSTIPIVFVGIGDPVDTGLVKSLARPAAMPPACRSRQPIPAASDLSFYARP